MWGGCSSLCIVFCLSPLLLPLPLPTSGVNVTDVRNEEETMMLADAHRLKNDPSLSPAISPGGATMLHVAVAKNYLQVLE